VPVEHPEVAHIAIGLQTCIQEIRLLVSRVELLEAYSNQQSILVDTLGDIMEELKKQEL